MIWLDTHVVAWLYAGAKVRFPPATRELIEAEALAVSPIAVLELEYLHEIGRVTAPAATVTADLAQRIGLEVGDGSLRAVASAAEPLTWARDPFDRLIAAQAIVSGERLLTADATLRTHLPLAVWG